MSKAFELSQFANGHSHNEGTGTSTIGGNAVIISGNLQVDGTSTTLNTSTLTVDDLNITVADGAANSAAADGGGITIDGAGVNFSWDDSNSRMNLNKQLYVEGRIQSLSTNADALLKVGVTNTSNYDAKLQIAGARTSSSTSNISMIEFTNSTSSAYNMAQISAMDPSAAHASGNGTLVFRTSSGGTLSDQMAIDQNGRVGIGSTTPVTSLNIETAGATTAQEVVHIRVNDTRSFAAGVGGAIQLSGAVNAGGTQYAYATIRGIKENATSSNYDGAFTVATRVNGGAGATEKLRILASGNVGIGTNAPGEKLDVNGDARIRGSGATMAGATIANASLLVGSTTAGIGIDSNEIIAVGDGLYLGSLSGQPPAIFREGTTEYMRINDGGKVGIGTNNPNTRLSVEAYGATGGDNTRVFELRNQSATAYTADALSSYNANTSYPIVNGATLTYHARGGQAGNIITHSAGINSEPVVADRVVRLATQNTGTAMYSRAYYAWDGSGSAAIDSSVSTSQLLETVTVAGQTSSRYGLYASGDVFYTGVLTLGRADTASAHINAYENMTFNIDTDNDDAGTRYFAWYTNSGAGSGTELMRLAENGNVGIGVDPSRTLHVGSGSVLIDNFSGGTGHMAINNAPNNVNNNYIRANIMMTRDEDQVLWNPSTNVWDFAGGASTDWSMIAHHSDSLRFYTGASQATATTKDMTAFKNDHLAMTIRTDGNIGIGTQTPLLKLDVRGNILQLDGSPEYHFGTTSASHYNWRMAAQEAVDGGFEIASGTQVAGTSAPSDTYTNRFVIQGSNGNVGIGTNSPSNNLTIDIAASNTGITLSDHGDGFFPQIIYDSNRTSAGQGLGKFTSNWNGTEVARIEFAAGADTTNKDDGEMLFYTKQSGVALAERMRIDDVGNVGIGTNSPDAHIHIYDSGSTRLRIESTSNAVSITPGIDLVKKGNTTDGTDLGIISFYGNDDLGNFQRYAYLFAEGEDTAGSAGEDGRLFMTVARGGNTGNVYYEMRGVGGSDNPLNAHHEFRGTNAGHIMHVRRDILDQSNSGAVVAISLGENTGPEDDPWIDFYNYGTTGVGGEQQVNGSIGTVNGNQGTHIWGYETLMLRASTDTDMPGLTPGQGTGLTITSSASTFYGTFNAQSISNFNSTAASTSPTTGAVIIDGGLGVAGDIHAGADVTAYSASDQRLKTNLQPIENSLDKVKSLTGYTFNWNELAENKPQDQREAGVIAQDVEAVLPEVTTTRDDGYKAVRYEKMVPMLIEAIKELSDKVDAQQQEIERLRNQS